MELDFGGIEPSSKRVRISIEPHSEKKVYHVFSDGKEQTLIEPTTSEKFARLVRQIDFDSLNHKYSEEQRKKDSTGDREDELKEEKQEEDEKQQKKSVEQTQQKWPWHSVAEHLYHARAEIEQMIGLIDLMQPNPSNAQLSVHHQKAASSSLSSINAELAIRQLTKQKELTAAASILSQGMQSLTSMIDREKIFFDELLQIRHNWLLTNRSTMQRGKQTLLGGSKQLGKLFVDYSYRAAGSKMRAEAELIQAPNGHVSVLFPSSNVNRVLYFSNLKSSHQGICDEVKESDNANTQLLVAQNSIFFSELYQQLADDILESNMSSVQVIENEIKIESDSNTDALTIRLKSAKQNTAKPPNPAVDGAVFPFSMFEVILYQLLRQRHLLNVQDLASDKMKQLQSPKSVILAHVVALYRHLCFVSQIRQVLNQIVEDLPSAVVHWYSSGKPFIAAFQIQFGKKFNLEVTIEKESVTLSSGKVFNLSAEELGRFVLVQLTTYIIDEMFNEANTLLVGADVRRDMLSINIIYPKKSVSIQVMPQKNFSLSLVLSESLGEATESKKVAFSLKSVPGIDITEKFQKILLNSNPSSSSLGQKKSLAASTSALKVNMRRVKSGVMGFGSSTLENGKSEEDKTPVIPFENGTKTKEAPMDLSEDGSDVEVSHEKNSNGKASAKNGRKSSRKRS